MHAGQVSASPNSSTCTRLKLFPSNLALKSTKIIVLGEIAYLLIDLKWVMILPHSIRCPFTVTVSHTGRLYIEFHIRMAGTALREADPKPSRAELWTKWH